MECEHCHTQEANVHLTQVADGKVRKLHLCQVCADKAGFDIQGPISITDILFGAGQAKEQEPPDAAAPAADLQCPACGLKRQDFKKTGRLGCAGCYETFAEELAGVLKAVHHGDRHQGKVPAREQQAVAVAAELAALQQALDQAVAAERFEEAARLRDRIQTCRSPAGSQQATP
jgi:protein arginine kinase activator